MKRQLLSIISLSLTLLSASAVSYENVIFKSEESDTTRITNLLIEAQKISSPQERIAIMGKKFMGTPYVGHTLEHNPEMLIVNLDELDCTTFVETVLTLAYTAGEGRTSWRDYIYNLERIRYRNGTMDGYPSRLHYVSNWIVDNSHRGNIEEVTNKFPKYNYIERTLSFMTENREKYEALKDPDILSKIKDIELGYSKHRFPYIKTIDIARKEVRRHLREGDIVAFVTNMKNLDVTHMGIIILEQNEPYLLHASSSNKKVEITKLPLYDYLKRNRGLAGIRVIRIKE